MELQEALEPHLAGVSFRALVQLVADRAVPKRLTRSAWVKLVRRSGLVHVKLAQALWDVWASAERRFHRRSGGGGAGAGAANGGVEVKKVGALQLVCGCAMLRIDPDGPDAAEVIDLTFSLIDLDKSGAVEPDELRGFLGIFQLPIKAAAAQNLSGFFRVAGFEDVYRGVLDTLLQTAFQRSVSAFVQHAFVSSDANGDGEMSRAEFRNWAKLNSNVTSWVASLSGFVLSNLLTHVELSQLQASHIILMSTAASVGGRSSRVQVLDSEAGHGAFLMMGGGPEATVKRGEDGVGGAWAGEFKAPKKNVDFGEEGHAQELSVEVEGEVLSVPLSSNCPSVAAAVKALVAGGLDGGRVLVGAGGSIRDVAEAAVRFQ
eukprot:COSAG01_NODE_302_length_19206_cov_11.098687_19_plen_374_part_00